MDDASSIFDLAVIGGGINGAGIAFDAAGRGARVLLLERGDLASRTSSASTKLIRAGLFRYDHLGGRELMPATRTAWTATATLPGGDFSPQDLEALIAGLARDYPFLAPADARRIGKAYGTDARRWLGDARSWADLGGHYGAGLTSAEVDWMTAREWAVSSEDILWRRSKLGLVLGAEGRNRLAADLKEQAA
ncbi:MAG TPA: FAD-dependent oxidoreductase [Sphingomicrobium sp.]|nr:FAD-dependent oxidoreductase [Sphingomicrobium sp.]